MTGRSVVGVVALVGLGTLAGVPITGLVDDGAPVVAAAAVAVVAALATCGVAAWVDRTTSWRHTSRWRRVAAFAFSGAIGSVVVAIVVAAVWPGPAGARRSPPIAAGDALVRGWSELATSPVPADVSPMVLVPLAVSVWWATCAGVVLFVRTRAPAAPLLPGAAVTLAASVAAGAQQTSPAVVGLGLVAAAAAVMAATAPAPIVGRVPRRNVAATVIGVAVAVSVVGVAVGPRMTFGRDDAPFDLRDRLEPPIVPATAVNPIELVASWLQRDDLVMFTVRTDAPLRTRLVALDAFDGTRWSAAATYERTGTVLPSPERDGVTTTRVVAEIELVDLAGPWLPSVADATRVTGTRVLVDPTGGVLLAGDDMPAAYGIEASQPDLDGADVVARMRDLPVAHDETTRAASAALPDPPAWVREMATEAAGSATAPYVQAVLLERYLRTNFRLSDEPVAGHSYGHLARALLQDDAVRGDEPAAASSEQLASVFAIVGRILGLPTRVVVGFAPGDEVGPGTYEVRATHAVVWPEVRFAEVGWVPFDPVPTASGSTGVGEGDDVGAGTPEVSTEGQVGDVPGELPDADSPDADDPALPADEQSPDPGDGERDGAGVSAPQGAADDASGARWWRRGALAIGLAVVSTVPFAAVALAKRRATRRRRTTSAGSDRVLGAWHDVRDRLVEVGRAPSDSSTVTEIVERSSDTSSALTGLYRPVSKALYGDEPITDDDADLAWRARDRFVEACRRESSWHERVRWSVDPRPLVAASTRRGGSRVRGLPRSHR